jgi:RNAse (barnase) inhibitor barstar
MNSELSVTLSAISSSYIRSENILEAVRENVVYMNEPVKTVFVKFLRSNDLNANIAENIKNLKGKVDNKIFGLWCDNLIICRENINQKYALSSIVEQFSSDKALWDELTTELQKPIYTLLVVILMCFSCFPIIYQLGYSMDIYNMTDIIFGSFTGQIIIVAFAVILFNGINKAINLSTSID